MNEKDYKIVIKGVFKQVYKYVRLKSIIDFYFRHEKPEMSVQIYLYG